jgi:beta-glucosidase-like glycosyl hydrolase
MIELLAISIRTLGLFTGLLIGLSIVTRGGTAECDETRVERILGQMTLQEKLDYIGGVNAMSIRPIPGLGVPEIRMSDGPLGVRRDTPSTRYPGGIALAASWNRALAGM